MSTMKLSAELVSVPIRGLFNLTRDIYEFERDETIQVRFRPHQGII